jgi:hypothetical protein
VLNTLRQPRDYVDKPVQNDTRFSLEPTTPASPRPASEVDLGKAALPIASMHLAHVDHMKKRFEEAKQRMNLIHERAGLLGGGAPFNRSDEFLDGGGVDDPSGHSSFLFDQFRRRVAAKNKQSAPPHPELTPQQKQHIYERSSSIPAGMSLNNPQQPLRRILSGGSVAERVMIFERCPVFNAPDTGKDGRVGTGGFPPGVLSVASEKKKEPLQINTTWRSNANEVQVSAMPMPLVFSPIQPCTNSGPL